MHIKAFAIKIRDEPVFHKLVYTSSESKCNVKRDNKILERVKGYDEKEL